jgi:hypothetical protein
MKINGKLRMNFGPVGTQMAVDNMSATTVMIDGTEPYISNLEYSDRTGIIGFWVTPEFQVGNRFSLSIPSGTFTGMVTTVERQMEDQSAIDGLSALGQVHEHQAQEMQIITVEGQWNGKQGGVNGGLCGLGRFSIVEVSSVEGTFGKAKSMEEYNARAHRYRSLYWSRDSMGEYSLTQKGEAMLRRYLSQFELDVEVVRYNSPYDWGTTMVQFAMSQVGWEREHNKFSGRSGLHGWVKLSFSKIPCVGGNSVDFHSFKQWLDMEFCRLDTQLKRQEARARANPTTRNVLRLERYRAAFASR